MKAYWPIIWLTVIGGFLRLYRLEASLQFLGDQGRDALVMYRLLTQGDWPFIGPVTSVGGFFLGPLYYYLMAPFLWLFRFNPAGPAIATALLGVLTVPAVYLTAKAVFNRWAALLAAGLYALAYIPLSETRSAWNPNPMPLAALGLIYGFYSKKLWLAALSLAAALQFHYMIVFLVPWILWQLYLNRGQWKNILWGAVLGLMIMSPLILFEIKNNWLNCRGLIEFLTKHRYGSLDWVLVLKNTIGRSEQAIGLILGFGRDYSLLRTWVTRLFLLTLAVFFKQVRFLGIYLLTSILTLAVYQESVYPHYLGFLFPVVFMLAGAFLARLPRWLAAALTVWFLIYNLPPAFTLINQAGNLKQVKATAELIKQDIEVNNYDKVNVALIDGTRDYPAMNFRYFLTVQKAPILGIDQYPQTQILYLISPYQQTDVLALPLWEVQALLPAEIIEVWESTGRENIYKIKRL